MHIHEIVFWGIVFFLIGVLLAPMTSLALLAIMIVLATMIGEVIAWRKRTAKGRWVALLLLWGIVGGVYWTGYNVVRKDRVAPLIGTQAMLTGYAIDVKKSEKSQRVVVALDEPSKGRIAITARPYPIIEYGDRIVAQGMVQRPSRQNKEYLLKDALFATMQFPQISIQGKREGNLVVTWLREMRMRSVEVYKRALPAKEAALLAGITLGERAEFDQEFKKQMANSGTTHLVALSGYNISVVAEAILLMCLAVMRRQAAFMVTAAAIVGFVVMAGAEASIVRAAIMGSIVLLARYIGRAYSMRNAIAISACAMVLWNPNVLRYDLGFQLSFLALIGIVYCKPWADELIKRGKDGVLEWRENLSGTLAAQIMVFPILMQAVGSFSWVALISNVLVLVFIPTTMGLGFVITALGLVAQTLAQVPAWIASLLLKYEIGVIELLGAQSGFTIQMTTVGVLIYYVCISIGIRYWAKKKI